MGSWFRRLIGPLAIILFLALAVIAQQSQPTTQPAQAPASGSLEAEGANNSLSPEAEDKLIREVRHELIMLPYYNVFDNLSFKVDGRTVVLEGQVTKPVLKTDAGNVVKRIEGVDKVINNIEVLPPSPMDDRIRRDVYQSIYSYGPLFKYGNMSVPPIHIIVKNGRITLEGVVDSESDKNLAGVRANQVPGTFQVTNNLRVVSGSNVPKKK
jgi:hyperosmotically inducible protein